MTKKIISIKSITNLVSIIIIIAIFGLFQFITAGFSVDIFTTAEFYINTLLRTFLSVITIYVVLNIAEDVYVKSNELYTLLVNKFKILIGYKNKDFKYHIDHENYDRRRLKLKEDIEAEIYEIQLKMDSKASNVKKMEKLQNRLDELYNINTEDENNINKVIKYNRVFEGNFSASTIISNNHNNRVIGSYSKAKRGFLAKNFLSGLVVAILISIFVFQISFNSNTWGELLLESLVNLGVVTFAVVKGIIGFETIFTDEVIKPLEQKIAIMVDYISEKSSRSYSNIDALIIYTIENPDSDGLRKIEMSKEIQPLVFKKVDSEIHEQNDELISDPLR